MDTSKHLHIGILLLSGAWSVPYFAACSGEHTDAPGSGGSGGTGPTTTRGEPTTTGGGAGPTTGSGPTTTGTGPTTTGGSPTEDWFACGLDLSCTPVCNHLGMWGDCGGDGACVESVWDSGGSGVILAQSRPGPGGHQSDDLFVLLGDGQVLNQGRFRSCPDGEISCDIEALPWSITQARRCELGSDYTLQVEGCRSVSYSCDEVAALLEGSGGAGGSAGGGGEAGGSGAAAE